MTSGTVLSGHYDYRLVALSVAISILAGYAALDLAERTTTARGGKRFMWLWGGAMAMGGGIWAMHWVGLVAFHLPVQILYDWPTVLLSLFIAIVASGVALFIVSRPTMGWSRTLAGSVMMGTGISAMHYIGMDAMRLPATCLYSPWLVALSVVLSIAISFVALQLAFAHRQDGSRWGRRKLLSGLIMGLAIPIMHYVGMAAASFISNLTMRLDLAHAVAITSLGLAAISIATIVGLAHVCIISSIDRRFALQNQQLAASEIQLKTIFFSLTEGIVVLDKRLNPVQINPAATRLLGFPPGKLSKEIVSEVLQFYTLDGELVPPAQWPGARALRGDFVRNCELKLHSRFTGGSVIAEVSTAPIVNAAGEPAQVIITYRDVTESKRAEAKLRAVVDYAVDGLITIDERGHVESYNPACERIFGYSIAEVIGRDIKMLMPEPYFSEHDKYLAHYAATGEAHIIGTAGREVRGKRKDGSIFPMDLSVSAFQLEDGRHYSGIVRDITERKLTTENQSRLAAIVESSEDAIIGKDLLGTVTSWNKGAEKIFGYTAEEMIGQSIQRLLAPGSEQEEQQILDCIRRGETVEHRDSVRTRKDGQTIQVSLTISPILDANNRIVGASKIARDITSQRMLERQLRQSRKMEAIGQLTGGIAHDFNNLLGVMVGNLDLLERLVTANLPALKRVQTAQKAAARGADLTRRLLALASKEDLSPANLRLEDVVHETIELAGRALGPEIRISTNFDRSVPPIYVDGTGLESALLNLAVNSRDAMPKGGTLTISTQLTHLDESFPSVQTGDLKPGWYARVSVTDTGCGMSRETLDRALEPFFTTKARNKGTGLGLAMVYGFAKQSGGTVRLYSELGYGTTVSLYLPLAGEASQASSDAPPARLPARLGGTVLVVDDEEELLEIAQAYLADMGYSALQAQNGASALEAVARFKEIDLIITDIIMPGGMNGVELAQKARQLNPRLKIIYSSGFPADALTERSGMQVDGPLLRKPYQRNEFTAIVHRTMEETGPDGGNNLPVSPGETFADD